MPAFPKRNLTYAWQRLIADATVIVSGANACLLFSVWGALLKSRDGDALALNVKVCLSVTLAAIPALQAAAEWYDDYERRRLQRELDEWELKWQLILMRRRMHRQEMLELAADMRQLGLALG